jgi:CBS domain-containing protein
MEQKDEYTNLVSLFLNTEVSDHLPRGTTGDIKVHKEGPVVCVQRDESLPRVFRTLATEGFLSCPVVDGHRYVGFVDMSDLVEKTCRLYYGETAEAWTNFWEKEEEFQTTTVDDILKTPDMFNRDPYPPIPSDFSSFHALELMARTGYHRLACISPTTNRVNGILTQSMIISWLRQHKSLWGTLRTTLVSDITDTLRTDVIAINENQSAINAFKKMKDKHVSGLAVVNDEGVLTGSISNADLKGVGTSGEYFYRLFRTVKTFKKLVREDFPRQAPPTHYSDKKIPLRGIFVTPDKTLEDVLNRMNDGNIHRVFVCDSVTDPKPQHVISQRDILKLVLDHIIENSTLATAA